MWAVSPDKLSIEAHNSTSGSIMRLTTRKVWRDNLGERLASIRMRIDCRGVVMMPALIVAGNGQSLV